MSKEFKINEEFFDIIGSLKEKLKIDASSTLSTSLLRLKKAKLIEEIEPRKYHLQEDRESENIIFKQCPFTDVSELIKKFKFNRNPLLIMKDLRVNDLSASSKSELQNTVYVNFRICNDDTLIDMTHKANQINISEYNEVLKKYQNYNEKICAMSYLFC